LRLRLFSGVASALLVIFDPAIAVRPMVALNVTLTAINVFRRARLSKSDRATQDAERRRLPDRRWFPA